MVLYFINIFFTSKDYIISSSILGNACLNCRTTIPEKIFGTN